MQLADAAVDTSQSVLQLHDVWKGFGDKHVLRGLDLDVRRGEILALLGPSGCGKSVLLKLIIGLLPVDRGAWALGAVGLADAGPLLPAELSGGMRKRVAVARTVALRPEVILYDEPTTGLDPINGHRIGDLIAALRVQLKNTSVVVTHDLALAARVADRIALLHEGRVTAIGPVATIEASTDPVVREFLEGRSR